MKLLVEAILRKQAAHDAAEVIHASGEVVLLVFDDFGSFTVVGVGAEDMLTYPEPPEEPEIHAIFYGPHDPDQMRVIACNQTTGEIQFLVLAKEFN